MQTFTPAPGTGDLLLNPNFVDPHQGFYSLSSSSPLISVGQFGYDMGAISYAARPMIPTNLQISTQPNQFTVQLSWTNPTENTDGSPLTIISGVQIYRNDALIATVTGMVPGGSGQYSDTVPIQADYRYRILAVSAVGSMNGLYAFTQERWIGPPYTALPTGPDAYGYRAYESGDPGGQPFNWIEISPPIGPGTALTYTQDDQTYTVDLPFTFQYYGLSYNEVSICGNGWIALGTTTDTDYSNSAIPNSDGPSAMLAPFWEDLSPQQSGVVSYYYDSGNHWFVVEFYRVRQYTPTTAFETFEVVLYDPAQYSTVTGDGKILFQWLDVDDPTTVTFGIENPAEAVGIELGLDNSFAATTLGILDGTAIIFLPPNEAFPVAVSMTPQNPPIVIPSGGGSFKYFMELSPPQGSSATLNVWLDVLLPSGEVYGPVMVRTVTLAPGQGMTRMMTQAVPGAAPAGQYEYRTYIGDYALGVVWSTDQFDFTKSGMDGAGAGSWACTESSVATTSEALVAGGFALRGAYPNPFNPTTAISYKLQAASHINLRVYDTAGRLVAILVDGWRETGIHEATFEGSGLPSGVYLLRLEAGANTATQKLMLLK